MAIELVKVFDQISTYVPAHESNYTIIEDNINNLLITLGSSTGASLAVPTGLREIFDRDGIIGTASYRIADGVVTTPTELDVPAGAAWMALSFRQSLAVATIDMTPFASTATLYLDVNTAGGPSINTVSSADSVFSFLWTMPAESVSAVTLLIDILFDGDDYADSLTSAAQAKTFESMADRFEDIESQLGALGAFYAQDTGTTTGLTFGYQAGTVRNDNVIATTAAGTIALTDNASNFIEVNPGTGVVTTNTTAFTTLLIPLFDVTTSGGAITPPVVDVRTWASLGGGGGGGHTQNTDTGTDSASFTLLNTTAGAPSSNASLAVDRGSSADVDFRWNETVDKWQFTNDGTNYQDIFANDIGAQELSKWVTIEDPTTVLDLSATTSSGTYQEVDLTAVSPFSGIPNGVSGMLLRIQYDDSAADATTTVLIRQIETPAANPPESMRVFARDSADFNDTEGTMLVTPGQGIDGGGNIRLGFSYLSTTSGAGTANLKIFVMGYWQKVTGTGSQDSEFTSTGNVVTATTTTQFNIAATLNRGMVHKFEIEETSGTPTAIYNVKVYSKDTFLAADLRYQVDNIDPSTGPPNWTDQAPWQYIDEDNTVEFHISIENTDAASGTYEFTVRSERFA